MNTKPLEIENRRDTRYLIRKLFVTLMDSGDSDEIVGEVLNLSLGGMLLAHQEAFPVGATLNIKITADEDSNEFSGFESEAQVMWFRQNEISGLFGSGFKFLDNSEEQREQLESMINKFAVSGVK